MSANRLFVTPAKAGGQGKRLKSLDSRLRGNDEQGIGEPPIQIFAQAMSKVRRGSPKAGVGREEVVATSRAHRAELHKRGVRHAALFGSIARGEGKRTSDIDILIELDPEAPVGIFEYVGITQYLSDLFPVRVDVANRGSLKPLVRPMIARDAIYAF
jgi:uncharacterized protein